MNEHEASSAGTPAAGHEPPEREISALPIGEPGMNFISADYDLIMVNRANERLYGKPVASLLGKKCYREFERREEPCSHCPGKLALVSGETHETEAVTWHGDGTRVYVRIRAHPVLGPDNTPTGFIEVVEDLTEERRAESIAAIESDLQARLLSAKNVPRALRATLDAALRIECLEWGCVFLVNRASEVQELIYQHGVTPDDVTILQALSGSGQESASVDLTGGQQVIEILPVLHRGSVIARVIAGGTTCRVMPCTLRSGLRSLGVLAGNAVSRIIAEQSRGDAVADLEAFIGIAPVPTWVLDSTGSVNKAAERVLGWQAGEVVGHPAPFGQAHREPQPVRLALRDGQTLELSLVSAPFRDVVGNASTTLVMADLIGEGVGDGTSVSLSLPTLSPGTDDGCLAGERPSVLIVDAGEPWGKELSDIVFGLGYLETRCRSSLEAAVLINPSATVHEPFHLAVVGMIYADGLTGLDQKSALRSIGLQAPVILSSDSDVHGHEHYGFVSVITRPYDPAAVAKAVEEALLLGGC
jgi:PAS domain S-box-containing protein